MATKTTRTNLAKKKPTTSKAKIPLPGRKLGKAESLDRLFKKFGDAMEMLAKH